MYDLGKIVGLEVKTIRGINLKKKVPKHIEPMYILFADGETYIELEEQDYHDYHDCASWARTIQVYQDTVRWDRMFKDLQVWPEANMDI